MTTPRNYPTVSPLTGRAALPHQVWKPGPPGSGGWIAYDRGLYIPVPITPPIDPFTLGTTQPTALNTASFADGELPVLSSGDPGYSSGDLVITAGMSGQTFSGFEVRGHVYATGSPTDVNLQGLRIVGRDAAYNSARVQLLDLDGFGDGLNVEQCEITTFANGNDHSRFWLGGIGGVNNNYRVHRCNIHDVTDAFYITGDDITITGNYAHHLSLRTDDTDHPYNATSNPFRPWWGHCDCIQYRGGARLWVEGNMLEGNFSRNTGMMRDPNAQSILTNNSRVAGNHTFDTTYQPVWWGIGNPIPDGYYPNIHCLIIQSAASAFTSAKFYRNWMKHSQYIVQFNTAGGPTTGNSADFDGNRWYPSDQTVNNDGTGLATQATIPSGLTTDATSLLTTIYAEDDITIPAGWRGHLVQLPSGGAAGTGNYKFNPALTP